jgi:hypothetical protein
MNRRGFLKIASDAPLVAAVPQAAANLGEFGTIGAKFMMSEPMIGCGPMMGQAIGAGWMMPESMRVAFDLFHADRYVRDDWKYAWRRYRQLRRATVGGTIRKSQRIPAMGAREVSAWARKQNAMPTRWDDARYKRVKEREYKRLPAWAKDPARIAQHLQHEMTHRMMNAAQNALGIKQRAMRPTSYPR